MYLFESTIADDNSDLFVDYRILSNYVVFRVSISCFGDIPSSIANAITDCITLDYSVLVWASSFDWNSSFLILV